jgi:hypothetical protein
MTTTVTRLAHATKIDIAKTELISEVADAVVRARWAKRLTTRLEDINPIIDRMLSHHGLTRKSSDNRYMQNLVEVGRVRRLGDGKYTPGDAE